MVHETDRFATAFARYGVWPTTVWHLVDSEEPNRSLKHELGDFGAAREGSFPASSLYKGAAGPGADGSTVSIFPPRGG